jgi:hypothetical protein
MLIVSPKSLTWKSLDCLPPLTGLVSAPLAVPVPSVDTLVLFAVLAALALALLSSTTKLSAIVDNVDVADANDDVDAVDAGVVCIVVDVAAGVDAAGTSATVEVTALNHDLGFLASEPLFTMVTGTIFVPVSFSARDTLTVPNEADVDGAAVVLECDAAATLECAAVVLECAAVVLECDAAALLDELSAR